MLKIRNEQIQVFEQAAVRNFEDRMIEHLKEFAPTHFKILKEDDIRKCVQYGLERAQTHALTSERSVRIYIQSMFMLGSNFDTDPQYPWAAEALGDEEGLSEVERSDRLYDKSWDYAAHVMEDYQELDVNADHTRFIQELRNLRHEPDEVLSPSALPEFYSRTITRLKNLFPRKSEYVGELSQRRLILHAVESAKSYEITTERGVATFVAMMFMLGSGFDADPQLPWASAVLNDQTITDQTARVNQLYAKGVDCLKRWWA